ncbi:MAG: type I 3-dehydroquinate dehydratase [Candidatus Altiarchaeales archaeon]|nr:type I 3-dehydroquinate dehydratase [Candidatus Altiarchaeales archaeon]
MPPMLCGCLTSKSVEQMVALAKMVEDKVDVFEVRLDYLEKLKHLKKLSEINKPLIVTCMPKWEGGRFELGEDERLKLLSLCLEFSEYVTYELRSKKTSIEKLVQQASQEGVKLILASHDFERTPSPKEICETVDCSLDLGADIAKVAYHPKTHSDVVDLLSVLNHYPKGKVIALSMGAVGRISRILAPSLGSPLTYAKIGGSQAAGQGQYDVEELAEIRKLLRW